MKHEEKYYLTFHAHKKGSQWFIDSGSKILIGDQNKFIHLKKKEGGNVTFGDNVCTKIVEKGTVCLGNEKAKDENVLVVEDLRDNFLSVSQMRDQRHTCTFNS